MGISAINVSNAMGRNGSKYVNDTASHAGSFSSIQFTEDSVLDVYTGNMENSSALISDATSFSQGQVIYGFCSEFSLASGACIAYID